MLFSDLLCSSGELGNAKVTSVYLRRDNIHSSQCLYTFHLYFNVPYYSEISFLLCDCNIAPHGTLYADDLDMWGVKEVLPGIVLSSTKPKKPPTNILVVRRTCSTWSSASTPEHMNRTKIVFTKMHIFFIFYTFSFFC